MNNNRSDQNIDAELKQFYASARAHKCPPSMKKNLYKHIASNKPRSWHPTRLLIAGLSVILVTTLMLSFNQHQTSRHNDLMQAQYDLEVAMHYMNRVSFKSITSVNNNGIKPGLIMPLAKSVAAL